MSGESSGWACEVPTEARDNVQVSKIDFFDMTTPFEMDIRSAHRLFAGGRVRGDFTVRTADRGLAVNGSRQ
jgi:hypothetical protein